MMWHFSKNYVYNGHCIETHVTIWAGEQKMENFMLSISNSRLVFIIILLEFSFPFVRPFVRLSVCPHFLHASYIVVMMAWVTWPERPKGAKDEVKQARRAPN